VQAAGFAEGAAGFAGVANERGHGIAAREHAADDLAADPAVAPITAVVIVSPFSSAANRTCSRRTRSAAVSRHHRDTS
jgi:hypothetical protein